MREGLPGKGAAMSTKTSIEWTEMTWNPAVGCSKVSPPAVPIAMRQEWVLNVKRQCDGQRAAFFFKPWGGWGADGKKRAKKHNGWLLQGKTWDSVPSF